MTLNKIYVLDTNVLLQDPLAIFAFEDNEVVIPAIVLEEVDSKKRYMDEVGRNARQVAKIMDQFREEGKLHDNVCLENGGKLRVELNHRSFEKLSDIFDKKTNDNRILAVALNLLMEEKGKGGIGKPVILVTKDALLRVKADVIGICAEDFLNDRVIQSDHIYSGYLEIFVKLDVLNKFYKERQIYFRGFSKRCTSFLKNLVATSEAVACFRASDATKKRNQLEKSTQADSFLNFSFMNSK